MKNTYTAIRCVMLDFWDHSQGECAASSDAAQQLELHKAELFAPRKLTLMDITEPRCIHLLGGGRICFLHAVRGEVLVSGDRQVRRWLAQQADCCGVGGCTVARSGQLAVTWVVCSMLWRSTS
jgi:hypothetical protein